MTITTYSNRKYASSNIVPFKGLCGEYSRFLYVYKITCIPTQQMKHYRSSAEYRQAQSQRMKARNADPKFNYIKENNSKLMKELWANNQAFQQKMKIAAKNSSKRQKEKFKNNPHLRDKVGAKHSRPLTNINEFTSPLNGQFFPEGTIFPSTMQCSLMIGAKHRRYVSSIIANHKKHPMQWWSKKDGKPFFVVEFAYIDILETKS